MISLHHITKRFGPTLALNDVSLELLPKERVALVGENGAGKSSLMNVLFGLYQPDAGDIRVDGKPVRLRSPKEARALGIGMVHQHFMLVPPLTVAENVVLGREPRHFGRFDVERACSDVDATCRRLGFSLDPRARVESLSVGSQQKVEIVRALHGGARVLILDEPTAVLTPQESSELFRITEQLSAEGQTVVFIGHKLREVLAVAQRVVVMRRGRVVANLPAHACHPTQLAAQMMGSSPQPVQTVPGAPQLLSPHVLSPPARSQTNEPFLRLRHLSLPAGEGRVALHDVSLDVCPGEVVGIAGVDGNGQRELAEVLTGLHPGHDGELHLGGTVLPHPTPHRLRRLGLAHIPEDRLRTGVIGALTVAENLALGAPAGPPYSLGPWRTRKAQDAAARTLLRAYDVRPPEPNLPLGGLSGGNQQKVVVARELSLAPRLLVAVQPTRGLDLHAVAQVHANLRAAKERGAGVLLLSLDLEEVLALSDRLHVLCGGRLTPAVFRDAFDRERIGRQMLSAEAPDGH